MATLGLVLLGYVAWEYVGTNVVSRHHQEHQVSALRAQWAHGQGPIPEKGDVVPGQASALVRIPRFGSDYVMPVLEGTSSDVLGQGLGHFTGTAGPGQVGNYALAGHRVTHGEPLRNMPELRPGDTVVVETRTAIYTYVLDTDPDHLVVPFTADWVIQPFPVNPDGGVGPAASDGRRVITLTTCSELFHTDDRMVAFGYLSQVRRRS
ncbi:MAG: class E sortase [Nocardioides sp.]